MESRDPNIKLHYVWVYKPQHCSLHSLPHKRQSSSNKISQHKLHSNMQYRFSTAHALYSFYTYVQDRPYLLCSVATTFIHNITQSSYTGTCTTTFCLPTINPPMHTINTKHSWQNGTRWRDSFIQKNFFVTFLV